MHDEMRGRPGTDPVDAARVKAATARAQALLLRARRADGSWIAYCDLGPAATAQVVVGLRFVDRLEPGDAEAARRWLIARQRGDGSFVPHPFTAQGDLGATACAWASPLKSRQ